MACTILVHVFSSKNSAKNVIAVSKCLLSPYREMQIIDYKHDFLTIGHRITYKPIQKNASKSFLVWSLQRYIIRHSL